MTWWDEAVKWAGTWQSTSGFWTAMQGIGTLLAAVAALIAIGIASKQLGELIRSNKLLADSNDAMTASNVALTRPWVVVDFEMVPHVMRGGGVYESSIFIAVANTGQTTARNLKLKVDKPFAPAAPEKLDQEAGWKKAIDELNRMMNGETVIHGLTNRRALSYYLDSANDFLDEKITEVPTWTVRAKYKDAEGRKYEEKFVLSLEAWRVSRIVVDPLVTIGKSVDSVAYEIRNKKIPTVAIPSGGTGGSRFGRQID